MKPKTRNGNKRYKHEMTDQDHIDLFEKANALKCKAAISGYECPLYEEMYTAGGWKKHIGAGNRMTTGKRLVREALWTNYQPNITLNLFD